MAEPQNDTSPKEEGRQDTRQCRICLAGVEEEPELGRLIKPCRCKGSIRYVHVKCLNTWRKTGSSLNSNSFWACGQCGFKYNLARTKILGLSTSPWVMYPTTVVLFFIIVFAASFVVSFFLPELDDPLLVVPPPQPDIGITWWHSPIGIASDVIRETVHTFAEVSTPKEVLEAQHQQRLRDKGSKSSIFTFRRWASHYLLGAITSKIYARSADNVVTFWSVANRSGPLDTGWTEGRRG
ncbi:16979_t:CDS:2, partial [Acaulospora colombiana]